MITDREKLIEAIQDAESDCMIASLDFPPMPGRATEVQLNMHLAKLKRTLREGTTAIETGALGLAATLFPDPKATQAETDERVLRQYEAIQHPTAAADFYRSHQGEVRRARAARIQAKCTQ